MKINEHLNKYNRATRFVVIPSSPNTNKNLLTKRQLKKLYKQYLNVPPADVVEYFTFYRTWIVVIYLE